MKIQKNLIKKILVADDDPAIVDAIQFMLEEAGYSVESTVDAQKVEKMLNIQPGLLLLDIWMSGMDGRDICKALKSQDKTKNIPIIMISANKDTEKLSKLAGADDFISKPFEMQELLEKVERYIN